MIQSSETLQQCELCNSFGGDFIYQNDKLRVINFGGDVNFPIFTRVIWQEHIKEMTDLSKQDREYLMDHVYIVESIQRQVLNPTKINMAQFGNITPHLHWHIIPRFEWDISFPNTYWSGSNTANDAFGCNNKTNKIDQAQYKNHLSNIHALLPLYRAALLDAFINHSL